MQAYGRYMKSYERLGVILNYVLTMFYDQYWKPQMLDIDNRRDCFKIIDLFMNKRFLWRGNVSDNWLINDYMKTPKNCEWQSKWVNQNQMFCYHKCLPSTKLGWIKLNEKFLIYILKLCLIYKNMHNHCLVSQKLWWNDFHFNKSFYNIWKTVSLKHVCIWIKTSDNGKSTLIVRCTSGWFRTFLMKLMLIQKMTSGR